MKLRSLLICIAPLIAQSPHERPPVHVDYSCPAEDVDSFGLTCSEARPCPVYFEISSVDSSGSRVFVAGDIHTATTTLFGVLLSTGDGGATWEEEIPRLRSTAFERFQFLHDSGWLSGEHVGPLPKDPFFMITTDGGKSWRERPVFEESRFGSISQFWFDSPQSGQMIFDHTVGSATNQQLYTTMTGGENWDIKQTSTKALTLGAGRDTAWSVTAPPGSTAYVIKRQQETFAHFLIHIGDCK